MASRKTAELCMVKESYTDREGKKKNKYVCLAEEFETDEGGVFYLVDTTINLAALPRKEGSCKAMMSRFKYDPDSSKGGNQNSQQAQSAPPPDDGDADTIPF